MSDLKQKAQRAFTLIELLVVIVVIAVLAAIIVPKFANQTLKSKEAALKSNLHLLRNAISMCQADTGYYPAALADMTSATAPTAKGYDPSSGTQTTSAWTNWRGPYLQGTSVPNDPVSGTANTYAPATGTVSSSATGNDSGGTAYSTY